jgi:protein SCO1/2
MASCKQAEPSLPYYNSADFTPVFINDHDSVEHLITHTIAPFKFTDQHNRNFGLQQCEGKIQVVNFFFTSCNSICPNLMNQLKKAVQPFASDTNLVVLSFSVTPWIDSVPVLKQYANDQGLNQPNWHLLTGPESEIYTLARKSYFAEEEIGFNKDSTDFLHTEHVVLVDKTGRIRGIYNGSLELEMKQLAEDVHSLKTE